MNIWRHTPLTTCPVGFITKNLNRPLNARPTIQVALNGLITSGSHDSHCHRRMDLNLLKIGFSIGTLTISDSQAAQAPFPPGCPHTNQLLHGTCDRAAELCVIAGPRGAPHGGRGGRSAAAAATTGIPAPLELQLSDVFERSDV